MQDLISWVVNHQAVVAGLGVAMLDLVFALNPNSAANGALHYVYVQLKKLTGGDVK